MTEDAGATSRKRWYQRWWVWVLIAFGALTVVAGIAGSSEDAVDEAAGTATTTIIAQETTTTEDSDTATTTEATSTTTTESPTTTTTLPEVLAEGEGSGDDVVEIDIPGDAAIVELTHSGSSNFAVWSLGANFDQIDLLVNEIGDYSGVRPIQFLVGEEVSGLEITAGGDWAYTIKPLVYAPSATCRFTGIGDSVVLVTNFQGSGGTATLTNTGDGNFAIWAYGDDRDLLVNEIGPYEGTIRVPSGLFIWDIAAVGEWTVDC